MNYILVGDLHVRKDNLAESSRLISWIIDLCLQHSATAIFMGDQHDAFGIVRAEVLEFWDNAYRTMKERGVKSVSLTGNHDLSADGQSSAMTAHKDVTTVVDSGGRLLEPNLYAIGFIRDHSNFVDHVLRLAYFSPPNTYVLCHQEFEGSQFENGFYSPHGIKIESLPQSFTFVAGHIHKRQSFGPIIHVGTPRMLTRSDIGEQKGVHLWSPGSDMKFISTPESVSEPFRQITIEEGKESPVVPNSSRTYVDIIGSVDFVKKMSTKMPESAKVRTIIKDDSRQIEIRESEGVSQAFFKFVRNFAQEKGTDPDLLREIVSDVRVRCPRLFEGLNG